MKDDSPFRHTLGGCEPTLAIGLRFRGQRHYTTEVLHFQITGNQHVV